MAYLTHEPPVRPRANKRRTGASPLTAPVLVFAAVTVVAAAYVAYVLWPRWPDSAVALDAPSLPIIVAGVFFNVEPAAIRMEVQRRPGTQCGHGNQPDTAEEQRGEQGVENGVPREREGAGVTGEQQRGQEAGVE